jgi:hypothetical protein
MARPEEVEQGWMSGKTFRLRVDVPTAREYMGFWEKNEPKMKLTPYSKGDAVKVVMVSRFGDCGITRDLTKTNGYAARVSPMELEPIEPLPENVCRKCNLEKGYSTHPGEDCPEWVRELCRD